jgi:hypothetical protein
VSSLIIRADGTAEWIYRDDLAQLMETMGECKIERASNVEPARGGGWEARMTDNGFVLGPFPLRSQALAAEVAYIEQRLTHEKEAP